MSVIEVAIGYAPDPCKFRVQVLDSPAGQASADVDLDVGALLAGRARFERALLLSGVPMRRKLSDEEKIIKDPGRSLFTALLGTGEVGGRYRSSVDRAADRDEQLRIAARIDAPELAALPWEAMYDEAAGGYVCRRHQLVRHVPLAVAAPPRPVKPPLRILGVLSAPRGMHPMNTQAEREQLRRALAEPMRNGQVEVKWAPSATWAGLHDLLLAAPWHVIHFVGHGEFDPARDAGVLYLTCEDGSADPVQASSFAGLLRQARPMPPLIVLNSCRSASSSTGDLFPGIAAALTRSGVPAVAAMQYSITDNAAVAFAREFYTALARGRRVDDGVSAGRAGILGTSDETLEWLTPVLYLGVSAWAPLEPAARSG
jgi:CHAT domain